MELSKKNREAISQLARSGDAQKLMALLNKQSGGGGRPGPADGHNGPTDAQQGRGRAGGPHRQPGQAGGAGVAVAGGSAYSLRHGPRGRDTSLKEGGA